MKTYFFLKRLDNQSGQALIVTLVFAFVLMVFSTATIMKSFNETSLIDRQTKELELFYLAEGGMEQAIRDFKQNLTNTQSPSVASYTPPNAVFSTAHSLPQGASATTTISQVQSADAIVQQPDGVDAFERQYLVQTTVTHPDSPNMQIRLNRIVTRQVIFAFNYGVFYDDDLEVLPGPPMTFAGRIHSNGDIYLGANSSLQLDTEHMRTTGDIYHNRKNDPSVVMPGAIDIRVKGSSPPAFQPIKDPNPAIGTVDSDHPNWTTLSQTRWNGTVKSSDHGVAEVTAPPVNVMAPGGYYESKASTQGLLIDNNTVWLDGNNITGEAISAGAIQQTTTFYNNREGKTVKMTEIDISALNSIGKLPSNGLIYAKVTNEGSNQPGVRLKNGSNIHNANGLTVVTPVPLYIQGDFNNVSKKPSAVIADAVNILSNAWDDSDDTKHISDADRDASDTEVNTGFISGIDTTTLGNYNGGIENYPRFHEDWSGGKTFTYEGSFIQLFNSQVASGPWSCNSSNGCYVPPNRNWGYDQSFRTQMPPFTPFFVNVTKGAWWKG